MRKRHLIVVLGIALGLLSGALPSAQSTEMPAPVRNHLNEFIAVFQRQWLYRASMDWASLKERVFEKAGPAQTIPETVDAIRLALTLLGDKHSYYVTPDGDYINNPDSPTQQTGQCVAPPLAAPMTPPDIAYLRIRLTTSAEAVQEVVRRNDRAGTIGWIVDLRDNGGGNTWPALAGLGSLLGDGTAGFFIDAADRPTPWGYTNGVAWLARPDQDLAFIESPYRLLMQGARVAVLTDAGVAGSAEALAIAFRARPNTRSFGAATCGLSTAVAQVSLSRGGRVGVVTSVMADRTMRKYGGSVEPDEPVADPTAVVPRAVDWLRRP